MRIAFVSSQSVLIPHTSSAYDSPFSHTYTRPLRPSICPNSSSVLKPSRTLFFTQSTPSNVLPISTKRTLTGPTFGLAMNDDSNMNTPRSSSFNADSENNQAASQTDLNRLQTALLDAIEKEDYKTAAKIRDQIADYLKTDIQQQLQDAGNWGGVGDAGQPNKRFIDWVSYGVPSWLANRAERLNYRLPLQIQKQTLSAMLDPEPYASASDNLNSPSTSAPPRDAVVLSQTGSGKTLAYLMPFLSILSELFYDIETNGPAIQGIDKQFPMVGLILVPTMELVSQVSLLIYQLLGGAVRKQLQPGNKLNMYSSYTGPRGIRIMGVIDESAAERAAEGDLLQGAHIVVGMPKLLAPAVDRLKLDPNQARVVVLDEADKILDDLSNAGPLKKLLRRKGLQAGTAWPIQGEGSAESTTSTSGRNVAPTTILVGASILESHIQKAILAGWLKNPPQLVTERKVYTDMSKANAMKRMPAGLIHRVAIVDGWRAMGTVVNLIRRDAKAFKVEENTSPPRMLVFVPNEDVARGLGDAMRDALWNESGIKVAILLPKSGIIPLKVIEWFHDNIINLLVLTTESARGLDFPQVSHVYNLYSHLNIEDYVHCAGRVGRIGQSATGIVTSILAPTDQPLLDKFGKDLGGVNFEKVENLAISVVPNVTEGNRDAITKYLNDLYTLYDAPEDQSDKPSDPSDKKN